MARSGTYAHYDDADIALQAAALAHGIAEGQPFVEGNKRVALAAMRTFLAVNGYTVTATQAERADVILDLARGRDVVWLADQIRAGLAPRS